MSYVHVWFCGTDYKTHPQCSLEIHCIGEQSAARIILDPEQKLVRLKGKAAAACRKRNIRLISG